MFNGGMKDIKHTIETKLKMSKSSRRANYNTVESRKKQSETMKGRTRSEETNKKHSKSITGELNHNYNKPLSEEHKNKISESLIGRYTGENSPHYKKITSDETKKKMSENNTGEGNPRSIPIIVDGVRYGCKKEAMKALRLSQKGLNKILDLL